MILPNEARVLRGSVPRTSHVHHRDMVFRVIEQRVDEAILAICSGDPTPNDINIFTEDTPPTDKMDLWVQTKILVAMYRVVGWSIHAYVTPPDGTLGKDGGKVYPCSMDHPDIIGLPIASHIDLSICFRDL